MVNSEELIGTTECLTLYTRCRINWCYNRVQLYVTGWENLDSEKYRDILQGLEKKRILSIICRLDHVMQDY
jgi:hypothetical protein